MKAAEQDIEDAGWGRTDREKERKTTRQADRQTDRTMWKIDWSIKQCDIGRPCPEGTGLDTDKHVLHE